MIRARAGVLRLRPNFTALETLDARSEASLRLDKVDAELIQTKALQSLCALHVSLNLSESIRHIVAARPGCKIGLEEVRGLRRIDRCCFYLKS